MNRSPEYAVALLAKARDDRFVVARLLADPQTPAWILGFHAQQAVEKSLKAVLAFHDIEYPPTHNLAALLVLLSANGIGLPSAHEVIPAVIQALHVSQ